jgi:indolepyruvate ferredoxin oxidoreductase
MGDSIYSNMIVLGAAWQRGLLPLSHDAIGQAIALNGAAVEANQRAFEIGRWAVTHPEAVEEMAAEEARKPLSAEEKIAFRADHLTAYQNAAYAKRYTDFLAAMPEELRGAVAEGYHKLLSYKDEYEVARLHLDSAAKAHAEFGGDFRMSFHLAPPMLSGKDANGRPKKRRFGQWVLPLFRVLAAMKPLRGTAFDPFGRSAERRMERALIAQYEADMRLIAGGLTPDRLDPALALARLPLDIRGFGPVKHASAEKAAKRREELLAAFRAGQTPMKRAAE